MDVKLIVPLILIKIQGIEMCAIKREKMKHEVGRSSGDLYYMLQWSQIMECMRHLLMSVGCLGIMLHNSIHDL